mmetsp:Transcript_97222/g.278299  ORF Transcript_97222/g.278299 Transcript_97222/m.278299 type:complete len:118 (+) Transcript_97222:399-752(+)
MQSSRLSNITSPPCVRRRGGGAEAEAGVGVDGAAPIPPASLAIGDDSSACTAADDDDDEVEDEEDEVADGPGGEAEGCGGDRPTPSNSRRRTDSSMSSRGNTASASPARLGSLWQGR